MCQHGGLHVLRYQMIACVPLNMAAQTDRGIPLSALNPNFLNSNSTSHTGPFSAIAELIDNAYDPDVDAKQFWIDKTIVKGQECLIFTDNGAGMDYDKMHKMLSFGFSDKKSVKDHVPVGIYGNGFKSGSMRLGKDAIVFSRRADTMCVGLLSQTYLAKIEAKHVVVPIAMFTRTGQTTSLEDILQYSLFETEEELMCELNAINGPCSMNSTGTRIIIWNLRKNSLGESEFDFSADRYDIQIPAESLSESTKELYKKPDHVMHSGPECLYSLRAYCSILYLKPRMQIIIRGQKVRTELISKSLAHIIKDKYKPKLPSIKKPITITFGYNTKSKEQYGVMLYHKNRLIKAYERVACQQKANNKGVGVIGVIECNFLTPTHNKQDFDYTEDYRKTMHSLNTKLEDYWKEVHHRFQQKSNIPVEDIPKQPDQNWVQCDVCLKWRKLPDGIDTKQLPEKWFCHMNPDPQFRSCAVEAELEDSDDDQVYQKTYKQHERNEKLRQAQSKQQMEQEQKKAEQKKITALTMQNADLMRKKQELERQLRFGPTTSPRTPDQAQPNSTANSSLVRSADFRSSDNMPVISEVKSLFATPTRKKRSLGLSAQNGMEKRARKLINFDKTPGSPSTGTASPDTCVLPSEFILDDDGGGGGGKETRGGAPNEDDDDDDDDIVVIETNSTPRPNLLNSDLSIVKTEKFSDDNGMDTSVATDTTVAATLPPPGGHVCTLTQTEAMQVMKHEMEDLEGKEEGARNREGESGICQSETGHGLLALERSTNQEQMIKSVTSLEKDNTEVNGREGTSEASIQTLDSNTVKLELQEDEPINGEILERPTGRAAKPGAEEYKTLYLQAQGEVEQLRRELDELKREKAQAGVEKKVEGEEGSTGERAQSDGGRTVAEVEDELACHVDLLMRELDQRIKQKEELENRLKDLQEERDCLMNRNEGLQKDLEEIKRDHEKIQLRLEDRGFQTDFPQCNQDESGMAIEGTSHGGSASKAETQDEPGMERGQGDDTTQTCNIILKKLRQNIACLLVNYVPALDIQQVNFDCDVIDDILSQVVEQISSPLAAWQSS